MDMGVASAPAKFGAHRQNGRFQVKAKAIWPMGAATSSA
jgi:hypothetical protein